MRRRTYLILLLAAFAALPAAGAARAGTPAPKREAGLRREIHVPFEDLGILLEAGPRRVFLPRAEYERLREQARQEEDEAAPVGAVLASADYEITLESGRALIKGILHADVLAEGLHALPLDLSGVGLLEVLLDGKSAAVGHGAGGDVQLFLQGQGARRLALQAVTPLRTTAAQQILDFRLPTPPATRLRLAVPGDVEVRSGAAMIRRSFDETANMTRMELLPKQGNLNIVLSLNRRMKQQERTVVARSVMVDEVTRAYERLHATVSLEVLHRAVGDFRFSLPDGFEVTDVKSPHLARWEVTAGGPHRRLTVRLRDETTDTVVINISAVRAGAQEGAWSFPRFVPENVVGHVSVVGVLLEQRLKARGIEGRNLIPIDRSVLVQALPETVHLADPGEAVIRVLTAYYAPGGDFGLKAEFFAPPVEMDVTSNILLSLRDAGLDLSGGFAIRPKEERLFEIDFHCPAGWEVLSVTDSGDAALRFEPYREADGTRIHARLGRAIEAGTEGRVFFTAKSVPGGWYAAWTTNQVHFPRLVMDGAVRHLGAVAVVPLDDLQVRPRALVGLSPLDRNEQAKYGLSALDAGLAYRYETAEYDARFLVTRTQPRLTAETYSFFRVAPDVLTARYEILFAVEESKTREVKLLLPAGTPRALSIHGLNGTEVKEYSSAEAGRFRRWTARLAAPRRDTVHVALDCELPLDVAGATNAVLPLVRADGVAYQSGFVSVEGSAELDIRIAEHPRAVDVGELIEAEYRPGRRLLGAFAFVGEPAPVRLGIARRDAYPLPPALVQRAELVTLLSSDGLGQSSLRVNLRHKVSFIEIALPEGSTLWSAMVDDSPARPQQKGGAVLLHLPAGGGPADVRVVYETPVNRFGFRGRAALAAPRLFLHEGQGLGRRKVPTADLLWHVYLPSGFEAVSARGTVVSEQIRPVDPAAARVARWLYGLSGGIGFRRGLIAGCAAPVMMTASRSRKAMRSAEYAYDGGGGGGGWDGEDLSAAPPEAPRAMAEPLVDMPAELIAGVPARATATRPGPEQAEPEEDSEESERLKTEPGDAFVLDGLSGARGPGWGAGAGTARGKPRKLWALEGKRSLKIDIEKAGRALTFRSLGEDPTVEIKVADARRQEALVWAAALLTFVAGVALTQRPAGRKAAYVIGVLLVSTVLPAMPMLAGLARVVNGAFYAACALVPYYLVAGVALKILGGLDRRILRPLVQFLAPSLLLVCVLSAAAAPGDEKYVVEMVPPEPLEIPDDALLIPYGQDGTPADRVLVPYDEFQALWRKAYPRDDMQKKPPVAYALAGAALTGDLLDRDSLILAGHVDIEVYTEEYVSIPFGLEGAVLERAETGGRPARVRAVEQKTRAGKGQAVQGGARVVHRLYLQGQGRHRLELRIRIDLARQGGWRVADVRLPAAPATALTLKVPAAETEVVLSGVPDRSLYKTAQAGETIQTTLAANGKLDLKWRPRIGEGEVDRTLTVESDAVLDIQEDRTALAWKMRLAFRRGEREFFSVRLPSDYRVEKVVGANVRGWDVEDGSERTLRVRLLQRTKEQETFTVYLWQEGPAAGARQDVEAPWLGIPDAIRHTGRIALRRSPLLDLRTVDSDGVRRVELPPAEELRSIRAEEGTHPLGIVPYQAYDFVAVPFSIRTDVTAFEPDVRARVQTILRVAERERRVESRTELTVRERPLYVARLRLPAALEVDRVTAPGDFEWGIAPDDARSILTVRFEAGLIGRIPIVIHGRLGEPGAVAEVRIPGFEALDVGEQEGDLVVQADPAFEVRAEDLANIESVLLRRVHGWLQGKQRSLARLALHYKRPDYAGRLVLTARRPDVSNYTVTNIRVTDRAIEETVLIHFTIRNAGIRRLEFLLPAYMADARIRVPLLRQKTVAPAEREDWVAVTLELQDEVMHDLRVLVESDRLLQETVQVVRLPIVRTGRTDRRYLSYESAGRDEVVVTERIELDPLSRQQKEYATVAGLLRGGTTDCFVASPEAANPRLGFETKRRQTVRTAGASIGLARTVLFLDGSGAYRAQQVYKVDNQTEQFLGLRLPEGAALWTARVAGGFVKPVVAEGGDGTEVRIPLVKTAAGDLDFTVEITYGGRLAGLGGIGRVGMPLIRTINIDVELSQVEVQLPRTHRWFSFEGTMQPVADEGAFEAGLLNYQTKLAERLISTAKIGSMFEQARAASNLKSVQKSINKAQVYYQDAYQGKALAVEMANAAKVMSDVDKQLKQVVVVAEDTGDDDNRFKFNEAYGGQDYSFTRNVVLDGKGNWDETAVRTDGQLTVSGNLSGEWLRANDLTNPDIEALRRQQADGPFGAAGDQEGQAVQRVPLLGQVPELGRLQHYNRELKDPNGRPADPFDGTQPSQAAGQQMMQHQLRSVQELNADDTDGYRNPDLGRKSRRGQRELAWRYQQELEADKKKDAGGKDTGGFHYSDAVAGGAYVTLDRAEMAESPVLVTNLAAGPIGTGGRADTGLVSLGVELPEHEATRWVRYRFSTPRGKVEINAFSVPPRLLHGANRLLIAALMLIAVAVLHALAGLRRRGGAMPRPASTGMILAGTLALLVGFLPIAALVVMIAGIVSKVRSRRRAAAAA